MKLSMVDRVILLNGFFPSMGNVEEMELIQSINRKIRILPEEQNGLHLTQNGDGTCNVEISDLRSYEREQEFDLTERELELMRNCARLTDQKRAVTSFSLETIKYLASLRFEQEEAKEESSF